VQATRAAPRARIAADEIAADLRKNVLGARPQLLGPNLLFSGDVLGQLPAFPDYRRLNAL
jgi:hypothetical protein